MVAQIAIRYRFPLIILSQIYHTLVISIFLYNGVESKLGMYIVPPVV